MRTDYQRIKGEIQVIGFVGVDTIDIAKQMNDFFNSNNDSIVNLHYLKRDAGESGLQVIIEYIKEIKEVDAHG